MLNELTRRANNDYDNRRMTEAAYMSGNKDAEKYAKGGIGNIKDLHELQDLQKTGIRKQAIVVTSPPTLTTLV